MNKMMHDGQNSGNNMKKDDQMIYKSANNSQISNNKSIRQNSRGQNSGFN